MGDTFPSHVVGSPPADFAADGSASPATWTGSSSTPAGLPAPVSHPAPASCDATLPVRAGAAAADFVPPSPPRYYPPAMPALYNIRRPAWYGATPPTPPGGRRVFPPVGTACPSYSLSGEIDRYNSLSSMLSQIVRILCNMCISF